eukprot:CAMPEP_0178814956 /NCGR_PEP_ID=MMETSP0746-20121128/561_1 /TAXON_ID=913974 /ORGANISM="Nitzschia punctata, Strain CCMP561" /LENGTH=64 /DNA_ID=CAMNT_0020475881 /DNA_START=405 /DNA_END=599 /DNA_ORIENTATION=-
MGKEPFESPLLVDVTECCSRTTFATTFEDDDNQDFQIMVLAACALVQAKVIQEREQSAATPGIS